VQKGRDKSTCSVIRELETKDICQVDDGLVLRVIDFGSGNICLDAVDLFIRPLCSRGVGVKKIDKIQRCEFTLGCALMANACTRTMSLKLMISWTA